MTDVISESALSRYSVMLNRLPEEVVLNSNLSRVVNVFKGNRERLTWAMRWFRIVLSEEYPDALRIYARDFPEIPIPRLVETAITMLRQEHMFKHYLGLPIQAIKDYRYGKNTPQQVLADFAKFEDEYVSDSQLIVAKPTDQPIISIGNFVWFNLHRPSCDEEGAAMGHCGNSYSNPHETILSLREQVKHDGKVKYKPCLTFILNTTNGALGEMKGRNNHKPAAKYHPQIMALLLNYDDIKAFAPGRYLPENDFSIEDLSPEDFAKLEAAKPEMTNLKLLKMQGCRSLLDGERPFWIAVFDYEGNIGETYTANIAEEADYHTHLYMSYEANLKVDQGRYFWVEPPYEGISGKYRICFEDAEHEKKYGHFKEKWMERITFVNEEGDPVDEDGNPLPT